MIDGLQTLIALHETGSISKAALSLRITQSAATKRLQSLKYELGVELIQTQGRHVVLTPAGLALVKKARSLFIGLKETIDSLQDTSKAPLKLAVSDSIILSWGAKKLKELERKLKFPLELHSHRSLSVHEFVLSGKYDLGLCTEPPAGKELQFFPVKEEEILFLFSEFKPKTTTDPEDQNVLVIEKVSATWKNIERQLLKAGFEQDKLSAVESFPAIVQMAKHGFGHGIVPELVAEGLDVPEKALKHFSPKVYRRIGFVGRTSVMKRPAVQEFMEELKKKL